MNPLVPTCSMFLALAAGGCSPTPAGPAGPINPAALRAATDALLPERMTIHALTRAVADLDGRAAVLVHIELRDRFNQNTRALGRMRLSILPPQTPIDSARAATDSAWVIDLIDPEQNARLYDDLVTRTYLFRLTDLPEWLSAWVKGNDGAAPTLVAEFDFAGTDGKIKTITASARLSR